MGDGGITTSPTLKDVLDELLPYMISLGMTPNEFWNGDPHNIKAYIQAEKIRRKRKNEELYLQGLYIYQAIGCFKDILPAFPSKNAKIQPYIKQPLPLYEEDFKKQEEINARERFEKIKRNVIAKVKEREKWEKKEKKELFQD